MEKDFWRRCCRLTLLDRVKNDYICEQMAINNTIIDAVEAESLLMHGHLCRMKRDRWPREMMKE